MKTDPPILVCIKRPEQAPYLEFVENSLSALQQLVGGYIESYTVAEDLTLLCNEEGLLLGLPYNATIAGNPFVGTVVAVGVRGEDFCSIPSANVPFVMRMMRGSL